MADPYLVGRRAWAWVQWEKEGVSLKKVFGEEEEESLEGCAVVLLLGELGGWCVNVHLVEVVVEEESPLRVLRREEGVGEVQRKMLGEMSHGEMSPQEERKERQEGREMGLKEQKGRIRKVHEQGEREEEGRKKREDQKEEEAVGTKGDQLDPLEVEEAISLVLLGALYVGILVLQVVWEVPCEEDLG